MKDLVFKYEESWNFWRILSHSAGRRMTVVVQSREIRLGCGSLLSAQSREDDAHEFNLKR